MHKLAKVLQERIVCMEAGLIRPSSGQVISMGRKPKTFEFHPAVSGRASWAAGSRVRSINSAQRLLCQNRRNAPPNRVLAFLVSKETTPAYSHHWREALPINCVPGRGSVPFYVPVLSGPVPATLISLEYLDRHARTGDCRKGQI
jgi:hypothetical protein